MELLIKPGSIAERLKELHPTHIAVAYVGLGWENYIHATSLKSVVVAPTFGSNATAIRQLIARLGIGNVHFLDHLHAKIFWSASQAMVGSSNLSDNGLQGDGGLIEAGVVVSDQEHVRQLKGFYQSLVDEAESRYDTPGKKYEQLNNLEALNQRASLGRLLKGKTSTKWKGVPVATFDTGANRRIHVCPYESDLKIKKPVIKKSIPGKTQATYEVLYDNVMGFLAKDDIREGDWILCIEVDLQKMVAKPNGELEWMYVDYVVEEASTSKPYTTVAIQERARKSWEVPFRLDAATKRAIRAVIEDPRYEALYDKKAKKLGLQFADRLTRRFIRDVQATGAQTA